MAGEMGGTLGVNEPINRCAGRHGRRDAVASLPGSSCATDEPAPGPKAAI
jgi:hypothetical protein